MSHGIEQNDTMFSVKTRPWHELGQVLTEAPTIQEGIKQSGLVWEVGLKPLYTSKIIPVDMYGDGEETIIDQQVPAFATYRKDDNTILGVVGPQYQPLQNDKAFEFFQPFLDSNVATLETAGSLFGGKKVFVLAKINMPDMMIVDKANDKIESYILLSNSHDGKQAVKVGFTPIRVVCNNTLSMAHNSKASKLIRVKHSSNVVMNLDMIRETMNVLQQDFQATAEQYKKLAQTDVNQADIKRYFTEVFNLKSEEEAQKKQRTLEQLIELFETGRGNHLDGVKNTAWAAYNASTEYMQYYSGRTKESRFGSLWFGPNQNRNEKALELALTL